MRGGRSGVKKFKSVQLLLLYAARQTIENAMSMMPQIQWIVDCRVADKQTAQLNVAI